MENPRIKAFLPFLYLVWSDDQLTANEYTTLNSFITAQDWLSPEERETLHALSAIETPPKRETLNSWKRELETIVRTPGITTLFAAATALSGNDNVIVQQEKAFVQLENDLGLLGEEVVRALQTDTETFTSAYGTAASFDIQRLAALLDGQQAATIARVKAVISRPEFAYETSTDTGVYREQVYAWCQTLAREGFGSMAYPKAQGGGEDLDAYFAIMETLSYHDLSLVIKFGVQFGLWGMSVLLLGTEKHHEQYLRDIGSLKLPGCFAMTETHHGSNVRGLETTATYNHADQTFTIHTPHPNAQKEYIGNAALHGQMATVFAQLIIDGEHYGVNTFIVPLRDAAGTTLPGITIGDCGLKMGLNGVDNGTIRFDQVVIPKANMLDRFARVNEAGAFESPIPSDNRRFFTMLGTLVGGRIGIPRSALAAAKSGLTITIRYSDQRRQFGPDGGSEIPILNYRMHQRRLLPLLAKVYALHFGLRHLTARFIHRKDGEMQEIEALAAGMKAYTTWHTRNTLQECREACGGKGYLSENRIDALKNDTEIYTTFEGDNTVLMLLTAKNRLSEFRKAFGELNALGKIVYVYETAKTAITEKNPIAVRKTDEAHLRDPRFHLEAFTHREKTTVVSAAKRLQKLIADGLDPYDASNVVQHQLIDVAHAYLDRVVLEQFHAAIEATTDKPCKAVLTKLAQLYALSQIEQYKAWYLEDGYMESVKTKAIRKQVNQLCWELRQDAVPLTEAFGIPESCLAAPIARLND